MVKKPVKKPLPRLNKAAVRLRTKPIKKAKKRIAKKQPRIKAIPRKKKLQDPSALVANSLSKSPYVRDVLGAVLNRLCDPAVFHEQEKQIVRSCILEAFSYPELVNLVAENWGFESQTWRRDLLQILMQQDGQDLHVLYESLDNITLDTDEIRDYLRELRAEVTDRLDTLDDMCFDLKNHTNEARLFTRA